MNKFQLHSKYSITSPQEQAVSLLVNGLETERYQVLNGITGSGKTFMMANIAERINRPILVLSHNKTLAAQLYSEFKQFFPNNAVEYFVSDFDYYLPESYNPTKDLYIAKDSRSNDQITKMRLSTVSSLQSGRRDVLVVSTVSCIFGAGNPEFFRQNIINLQLNQQIGLKDLLLELNRIGYHRVYDELKNNTFRVIGDQVEIHNPFLDTAYRIYFFNTEIEHIHLIDPKTGKKIQNESNIQIFPAKLYNSDPRSMAEMIEMIKVDLELQVKDFERRGLFIEAKRIKSRTEFDLEMMQELGYCQGIENYSRYIDRRKPGERPNCLLDYFPSDYVIFADESHISMPQIRAMYAGNQSMKANLVDFGWRLPSAIDNRPLKFSEFEECVNQIIYVSATPADYELNQSNGVVVEQLIRPTGIVDPIIEVKPTKHQIDDLVENITAAIQKEDRVLITTLTKKMSEHLNETLTKFGFKCCYMHGDLEPIDRIDAIRKFRLGEIDIIIGVNLLREGLDMPEVSLVCIMDADKEGFLRNKTSMIQTIGRAARNINGRVILYADKMTGSMEKAIEETNRRRKIQLEYNEKHNITPLSIKRTKQEILDSTQVASNKKNNIRSEQTKTTSNHTLEDPVYQNMSKEELNKQIKQIKSEMLAAAKELDFILAAKLRDVMFSLETKVKSM